MQRVWMLRAGFFALAICFCGCKVGPDYAGAPLTAPVSWTQGEHPALQGAPEDLACWWRTFQDPALDQLIQRALSDNVELKEAGRRVLEVRALRNVVAGNLYPQQQALNGNFNNLSISENTANFVTVPGFFETDRVFDNWNTNFGIAWELDFWGRLRRAVEAADANVDESIGAYQSVQIVLLAEVARSYIEMRMLESQIAIVQQQVNIQQSIVNLAEMRLQEGVGNRLDLAQTKSNLYLVDYELPRLETLRRQASHRICMLTGTFPVDLQGILGNTGQIPAPSRGAAVGIPVDLLRRRPDIFIAERQLAAQSAKIGIAEAELYPHITLTGVIGLEAQDLSSLFSTGSLIRTVGPGFSWKILNYGRIKNRVAAETEAFNRLYHAYQRNVLTAYQEAEDAQVSFVNNHTRLNSISQASINALEAARIGHAAYAEGTENLNRVLQLQRDYLRAEFERAAVRGELAMSLVKIYLTVGGGWRNSSTIPQVVCRDATMASH